MNGLSCFIPFIQSQFYDHKIGETDITDFIDLIDFFFFLEPKKKM